MKEIYCLFQITNEYYQPDNDLVAWFSEKPSFDLLAKAMECEFIATQQNTLAVVNVWKGEKAWLGEIEYRLEVVKEFE